MKAFEDEQFICWVVDVVGQDYDYTKIFLSIGFSLGFVMPLNRIFACALWFECRNYQPMTQHLVCCKSWPRKKLWIIHTRLWFHFFNVHPYLGKWSILTNIFSNGLKPPTRYNSSWRKTHHQLTTSEAINRLGILMILVNYSHPFPHRPCQTTSSWFPNKSPKYACFSCFFCMRVGRYFTLLHTPRTFLYDMGILCHYKMLMPDPIL